MIKTAKINFKETKKTNLEKRLIGSIVFNFVIFALMIVDLVIIWTIEVDFDGKKWTYNILKFFTFQTNVFNGLICFIYAVFALLILSGKKNKFPKPVEILKHCGVVGVGITAIIVTFVGIPAGLIFLHQFPVKAFWYSSAFYHVAIPVLTIITWFVFEHSMNEFRYRDSLYSLIYVYVYSIFYLTMNLTHIENGSISRQYDWYYMWSFGAWPAPLILIGTYATSYLISWATWIGNKKINVFPIEMKK